MCGIQHHKINSICQRRRHENLYEEQKHQKQPKWFLFNDILQLLSEHDYYTFISIYPIFKQLLEILFCTFPYLINDRERCLGWWYGYCLTIGWIFTKFLSSNKDISHITPVFDLTYFSMSQRSNFEFFMICINTLTIGWIFTKYLFMVTSNKDTSLIAWVVDLTYFLLSQRKDFEMFTVHKCICTLPFPGLWFDYFSRLQTACPAFAWQWTA
jgi:hypothetical protein